MFVIKAYHDDSRTVYEAEAYTVDEFPDHVDVHFWKNQAKDDAPQLIIVSRAKHDFERVWIENANGKTCDSVRCPTEAPPEHDDGTA